eukprot:scaffold53340_cov43-Phaeocystis_antarctica.AAC.2
MESFTVAGYRPVQLLRVLQLDGHAGRELSCRAAIARLLEHRRDAWIGIAEAPLEEREKAPLGVLLPARNLDGAFVHIEEHVQVGVLASAAKPGRHLRGSSGPAHVVDAVQPVGRLDVVPDFREVARLPVRQGVRVANRSRQRHTHTYQLRMLSME